jgi:predicted nucleic-acid-binding Zn-ribbon protein
MEILERVSQGHCPKCGSADINSGNLPWHGDESIFYKSDCNECKSKFHEHYNLKFSGMSLYMPHQLNIETGKFEMVEMEEGDTILNERRKTTDETKKA